MRKLYFIIILLTLISCTKRTHEESGDELYIKAREQYSAGNYPEAKELFKKSLKHGILDHSISYAFTYLGNTYSEEENYDSSIFYYKMAVLADSTNADAWSNMGIDYRISSNFEEAEKCYRKALEINPDHAESYTSLGWLYILKGDSEKAISNLEYAIELDPQLTSAHANYAVALAMQGEFEKAEQQLKAAIAMGYKNGAVVKERIEGLKEIQ